MNFNIPKSIETEIKIWKLYLFDILFILGYMAIASLLKAFVYQKLIIVYYIFCFLSALFLTSKSIHNPRKRNLRSIYLAFLRDKKTYRRFYK